MRVGETARDVVAVMGRALRSRFARWLRRHALYVFAAVAGALMLGFTGVSAAILLHQPPARAYLIDTPTPTLPVAPTATPRCGTSTTPACPTPPPEWIPLAAQTPQAVLAAVRESGLFNVDRSGNGDYFDVSRLGTPQLVEEYRVPGWYTNHTPLGEFYAIPVLDTSGTTTIAVAQALLNPRTRPSTPRRSSARAVPGGVVNLVSRQAAIADVQAQQHTGLRAGASARLVYIPSDPTIIYRPGIALIGGSPSNPAWLVPGTDGQDHIVGEDGHVFTLTQLEAMAKA
jgi:hypothetical protein